MTTASRDPLAPTDTRHRPPLHETCAQLGLHALILQISLRCPHFGGQGDGPTPKLATGQRGPFPVHAPLPNRRVYSVGHSTSP